MLELYDARPEQERDLVLRTEVNSKLLSSLHYLLKACQRSGLDTSLQLKRLSLLNSNEKLSGMVHVIHNRLHDAVLRNSQTEIEGVLEDFCNIKYNYQDVRLISWYDNSYSISMHQLYFDACDDGFRKTYGVHFDGTTLTNDKYKHSQENALLALKNLKNIAPDIYQEFNTLVSDVMLLYSPTMNAASSMSSLGIIRMSQLRDNQRWTRYFENIVHEAAHQHLNYLWFVDPIILNEGEELYSSPLRKEKRPLSGIYHALFVLARSMYAIKLLENSNTYNPITDLVETAYNNAGNNASFEQKFNDCWVLIKENAKLTEIGEKLLYSARELAFD